MISAFAGSIWMTIIIRMNTLRPEKRNLASATAARNASTSESATVTRTTIRLFFTDDQKYGVSIALRKFARVAFAGIHLGV